MLKHVKRTLAVLTVLALVGLVWGGMALSDPPPGKGGGKPKPPPLPPPEESTGTIFYCEDDDSGVAWISRMNWDGTGATRLYSGVPWVVTGWDVSHSDTEGSRRFLIYEDSGGPGLYVVDLWDPDLTPRWIYGTDSFYAWDARLSQDDTKVAFLGLANNLFDGYLYVAALEKDGNGVPTGIDDDSLRQVAYVGVAKAGLTWSPDGNCIAFVCLWSDDSWTAGEIYVVSLDTGAVTNITNTPGTIEVHFEWSPVLDESGTSRIAFAQGGNIYTVPAPGGGEPELAVSSVNTGGTSTDVPSWSPDGKQIAFFACFKRQKNRSVIMRSAADGSTSAVDLTGLGEYWGAIKWRPGP